MNVTYNYINDKVGSLEDLIHKHASKTWANVNESLSITFTKALLSILVGFSKMTAGFFTVFRSSVKYGGSLYIFDGMYIVK